ncbi:hypothetical protein CDAR_574821 [Caerostris darwini]|uniref:Uncharacterized protein n=1 Tax=Caerostris darwini TaxID=1538125 RepID=A0AAV4T202_9ARAC|nr:hypothetical protein CDAR_574821 [Caerostris darwini]
MDAILLLPGAKLVNFQKEHFLAQNCNISIPNIYITKELPQKVINLHHYQIICHLGKGGYSKTLHDWNDWRNFRLNLSVANFQRQKNYYFPSPSPSPNFSPFLVPPRPFPKTLPKTIPNIYPPLKVASA